MEQACGALEAIASAECRVESARNLLQPSELGVHITLGAAIGAAIGTGLGVAVGSNPLTLALVGGVTGGAIAFAERYVTYLLAIGDRQEAQARLLHDMALDMDRLSLASDEIIKATAQTKTEIIVLENAIDLIKQEIVAINTIISQNRLSFAEQEIAIQNINARIDLYEEKYLSDLSSIQNTIDKLQRELGSMFTLQKLTNESYEFSIVSLDKKHDQNYQRILNSLNSLLSKLSKAEMQFSIQSSTIERMREEVRILTKNLAPS